MSLKDSFTDVNGTVLTAHTSDSGHTWAASGGSTFKIQSNATYTEGNNNTEECLSSFSFADGEGTITFEWPSDIAGTENIGICFRGAIEASAKWKAYEAIVTSKGELILRKFLGGSTPTTIKTGTVSLAVGQTHTLGFKAEGTKLKVLFDGKIILEAEDPSLTEGRVGVEGRLGSTTQGFRITEITASKGGEGGEIHQLELKESIILADARTRNVKRAQADRVGLSEVIARRGARLVRDGLVISAKPAQLAERARVERLSLSDATNRTALRRVKEALGLADSFGRGVIQRFASALSLTDEARARTELARKDSLAVSESQSRTVGRVIADVLSLAESAVRKARHFVADSISLSDSSSETPVESGGEVHDVEVADALVLTDQVGRAVSRTESDSFVLSDAVGRAIDRAIADSFALSEAITRRVDRSMNDVLRLADSWARRAGLGILDALHLSDLLRLESGKRKALTLRIAIRPKLAVSLWAQPKATVSVSIRPKLNAALSVRAKDKAALGIRTKTKTNLTIRG
jgi:hypothetical protein